MAAGGLCVPKDISHGCDVRKFRTSLKRRWQCRPPRPATRTACRKLMLRATTCLLAVARGIEPDGLGHDVASRAAFRNPTVHDCPPDSRRCRSLDTGEIGEFPQSRRWRGVPTGVELGRDVGNFPTSFRAYITYAAD
jgi:hypothetical protein